MNTVAPIQDQQVIHSSFLHRIAEALQKSAAPYSLENHRLAQLGSIESVENPLPRFALAENVWVDFEAEMGVSANVLPGKNGIGVRLQVSNTGKSRWFSFSYDLSLETARTARYLGLLVRADSRGMAALRPCVRYVLEGSIQDRFPRDVLVFRGGSDEQLCFIKLDQDLLEKANAVEVLFFFEGKKFDVTLLAIENLYV